MKKKINVIDLDNTMIPYNSFFRYVLYFMGNLRLFFPILFLSFLRLINVLHKDTYQKRILLLTRKTLNYQIIMEEFSSLIFRDIKKNIIQLVQENTDENTINILCTSSPGDYVYHLCKKLKDWRCLCSTFDECNKSFYHLFGPNKVTALTKHYRPDLYYYNMAISDSKTDLDLLKLFEKGYFLKKEKIKKLT